MELDLCTPACIHVAAVLRISDLMDQNKSDIRDLARAAGADPESLCRVLRHLANNGIFEETSPGHFAKNDNARSLFDGIFGRMTLAWGTMLSAVRTGNPAYHEMAGRGFWEDLDANPGIAESFDALMGPEGHGIPDARILLNENDWESVRTVVDVGGGTGALLMEILRARPQVHATLVDLPATIARARPEFEAAGLTHRVTFAAQSFFDTLPAGKDLYTMKNVLADWPDHEAELLLRRCAEAAASSGPEAAARSGKLAIVGGVTAEPIPSPELLMMVLVGGKSRTLDEFATLARRAGLDAKAFGRAPCGKFVVECSVR